MSDNRFPDLKQPNGDHPRGDSWEQEPFAPYDDPFINPEGTGTPLTGEAPRGAFARQNDSFAPEPPMEESVQPPPQQANRQPVPARPEEGEAAPRRGGRVSRFHESAGPQPPDTQPVSRQADPDERFSGPRTAMPQESKSPVRPPIQDKYRVPVRGEGTPQPRPQAPPVRQKPAISRPKNDFGWPTPGDQPPAREPGDGKKPPRRGGRGFLILLIILIVLGGAFAGIWLPDWDSVEGAVGETMSAIQDTLKNLIMPEEIVIRAFSVQPDTGTAG
ncbi:MAG: hypothetical protein ABIK64_07590, partial [Bacillota bacterium]